jgi:hypothetical protein
MVDNLMRIFEDEIKPNVSGYIVLVKCKFCSSSLHAALSSVPSIADLPATPPYIHDST